MAVSGSVSPRSHLLTAWKGMTQNELGNRLGISFQAVSKWERGETLPDTAILLDLARVLDTTVDQILSAGEREIPAKGRITVAQVVRGLNGLKEMGEALGRHNPLYRHAVEGINEKTLPLSRLGTLLCVKR